MANGEPSPEFNQAQLAAEQALRDQVAEQVNQAADMQALLQRLQEAEMEAAAARAKREYDQKAQAKRSGQDRDAMQREIQGRADEQGSLKRDAVTTEAIV